MKHIIPDFFIIGGPKCGTTSLASYLDDHPNVLISNPKEPFFFSTDLSFGIKEWDEYNACFSNRSIEHKAIGDASVDYLFSKEAVPNILQSNPKSKFIVIVRNPIDMAYSLHSQLLWSGIENISDFWEAFITPERKRGFFDKLVQEQAYWLQYKEVCSLGSQLERLFSIVPSEQVKIIVFDDLKSNIGTVYQQVLDFLDVPQDHREDFPIHNENKVVRSRAVTLMLTAGVLLKKKLHVNMKLGLVDKILNKNTKNEIRPKLSVDLRYKLGREFRSDILKTSRLLNRNFDVWLDAE